MRMRIVCLLLTVFFVSSLNAQTVTVSGKVLNDKNEALAGVSVNLEGTGGTSTNLDGHFNFTVTGGKAHALVFTAIGYKPKNILVEANSGKVDELLVVLETASKDLNNVVVSARSTARRESVNALISFQKNTNTVASVIS